MNHIQKYTHDALKSLELSAEALQNVHTQPLVEGLEIATSIMHHVVSVTALAAIAPLTTYCEDDNAKLYQILSQIASDVLSLSAHYGRTYTDIDYEKFHTFSVIASYSISNKIQLSELFKNNDLNYSSALTLYAEFVRTTHDNANIMQKFPVSVNSEHTPQFILDFHYENKDNVPFDQNRFLNSD